MRNSSPQNPPQDFLAYVTAMEKLDALARNATGDERRALRDLYARAEALARHTVAESNAGK